jgi:hypothetical protein
MLSLESGGHINININGSCEIRRLFSKEDKKDYVL